MLKPSFALLAVLTATGPIPAAQADTTYGEVRRCDGILDALAHFNAKEAADLMQAESPVATPQQIQQAAAVVDRFVTAYEPAGLPVQRIRVRDAQIKGSDALALTEKWVFANSKASYVGCVRHLGANGWATEFDIFDDPDVLMRNLTDAVQRGTGAASK